MRHQNQAGLSIVELVIALFVASSFIISGYLLYSFVMKETFEVRNKVIASQLAYQKLIEAKELINATCAVEETSPENPTPTPLNNLSIKRTIDCPETLNETNDISRIEITITYGDDKKITQAIYAKKP